MYERNWYVGNDLLLIGESLTLKGHKFSARSDPRDYTSEVKPFKNKNKNSTVGGGRASGPSMAPFANPYEDSQGWKETD